ncbi:MAG: hypothetical protein BWY63_03920 [Chloroflexi bacterium ADurb.Bin360]|nr:MAG: hypothetical protein BWY63_03920 [Chloroflexi bacterium ADurb.Bin360]
MVTLWQHEPRETTLTGAKHPLQPQKADMTPALTQTIGPAKRCLAWVCGDLCKGAQCGVLSLLTLQLLQRRNSSLETLTLITLKP